MSNEPRWDLLADAVRRRRSALRLRQRDLADRGGPGHVTVRKIENGEATDLRAKTKGQLERALAFRSNLIDDVLSGRATDEDLTRFVVQRDQVEAAVDASESMSAAASQLHQATGVPLDFAHSEVARLHSIRATEEGVVRDLQGVGDVNQWSPAEVLEHKNLLDTFGEERTVQLYVLANQLADHLATVAPSAVRLAAEQVLNDLTAEERSLQTLIRMRDYYESKNV